MIYKLILKDGSGYLIGDVDLSKSYYYSCTIIKNTTNHKHLNPGTVVQLFADNFKRNSFGDFILQKPTNYNTKLGKILYR